MQIQHTSRHEVHATEAVKQHIEDKLQRCLGVFPRLENVHVILDHEARLHVAEIVVQAAGHIRLSATEKSENLYFIREGQVEISHLYNFPKKKSLYHDFHLTTKKHQ